MTPTRLNSHALRRPLRASIPLAMLTAIAATLVACGGGGSSAPPPPPTQTAASVTASGPITGFGSVIVNGMRFDDSAVTITDDNGHTLGEAELHLGMQCDVDGLHHEDGSLAADSILVHSALVGPVEAVDTVAGTVTVLEQTVAVSAQTSFDDSIVAGLAGLTAGEVVEVHAQFDATSSTWRATRIEPDATATQFKIRGTITALDPVAMTLQVGATHIDYHAATGVPSTLAVGSSIDARLQTTAVGGVWQAIRIDDGRRHLRDHDEAHVRGIVSDFTSATSFSVDGMPVDASQATFENGQSGIVLGASVEVEGRIAGGVLVASDVKLEDEHAGDDQGMELHGTVSALDTVAKTFVVRGTRVSYAGEVVFRNGTADMLAEGVRVEVKGGLSADGTMVAATEIDLNAED